MGVVIGIVPDIAYVLRLLHTPNVALVATLLPVVIMLKMDVALEMQTAVKHHMGRLIVVQEAVHIAAQEAAVPRTY